MLNAVKQELFFPNKNSSWLLHKNAFWKSLQNYVMLLFYEVKDVVLPALDNNALSWEKKEIDSKHWKCFLFQTPELHFNDKVRMIYNRYSIPLFLNNKNHTWSRVAWNRWWVWKSKLLILHFILPVLEYLGKTIIFTNSF